jgi:hypothetical protein
MLGEARAAHLPPDVAAGLESLGAMYVDALPELERWAAHLPPEARAPLRETFESPLALADFLVLTPKARRTVLGKAHDLERLLLESSRSVDMRRVSPRGAAVFPLVVQAETALAARRAASGAPATMGAPAPKPPATMGAPAPTPPAESSRASGGKRSAPLPTDVRRQSAEEVLAILRAASAQAVLVRLFVRSGDGLAIHDVTPSAIQPRGTSSALLAIDPDTDEGRVFHLPDVLAVVRPPAG